MWPSTAKHCTHDAEQGRHLVHLVRAWVDECSLSAGQVVCEEKSNEIEAIPRLLEMLKLARKKSDGPILPKSELYTLPSWNLRARSGLDLTKLAHVDEDDLSE